MGRAPCCDKNKVKRGPWSLEEDTLLKSFIHAHGTGGNWISLPHKAGLNRCGKSCRLRWLNYLRPNIKHGGFTEEEDYIICKLYSSIGSRWSVIASKLSGRTDNDVKNYWNTKLKKKIIAGKVSGFDDNLFHKTASSQNGLARLGWTGFGEMVPKPEITAFDYGASFVPYTQAVEGQQSWGPYIYGGVHDIEEKKSSVCDSQSVSCGSSSIQKVGEEFAENDTEDFWLKLLVDQSTFMGGGCGPCGSSSSEIGLHDKINELASVVRGASFSFPGYY